MPSGTRVLMASYAAKRNKLSHMLWAASKTVGYRL
jgi:hypothetical protein